MSLTRVRCPCLTEPIGTVSAPHTPCAYDVTYGPLCPRRGSLKVECRVSSLKSRVWKKKIESAIFPACVCVLPLALIVLRILLTQVLALRAFIALRWKLLALRTLLCVCWEGNHIRLHSTLLYPILPRRTYLNRPCQDQMLNLAKANENLWAS